MRQHRDRIAHKRMALRTMSQRLPFTGVVIPVAETIINRTAQFRSLILKAVPMTCRLPGRARPSFWRR